MTIGRLLGNNTLCLNEATMMVAVQMWLDSFTVGGSMAKVKAVRCKNDPGAGTTFEVQLCEAPTPPPRISGPA